MSSINQCQLVAISIGDLKINTINENYAESVTATTSVPVNSIEPAYYDLDGLPTSKDSTRHYDYCVK
jgi:hypothetical protein